MYMAFPTKTVTLNLWPDSCDTRTSVNAESAVYGVLGLTDRNGQVKLVEMRYMVEEDLTALLPYPLESRLEVQRRT